MLEAIEGLRAERDGRSEGEALCDGLPGGRVDKDICLRYGRPIADYARTVGYGQVNWLRGAIAVYVANRQLRREMAA